MKLDEIDFKILEILRMDARTPFTEVGKTLGIADSTVHHRMKNMVNEGIVKRYTIEVDDEILGKISCFLRINVDPGHLEAVVGELIKYSEVDEVFETHGPCNIIAKTSAENLNKIRSLILKIRKLPNIAQTEMITILKKWNKLDK